MVMQLLLQKSYDYLTNLSNMEAETSQENETKGNNCVSFFTIKHDF